MSRGWLAWDEFDISSALCICVRSPVHGCSLDTGEKVTRQSVGWVYYTGGNGYYEKTGAGLLVIYLE